MRSIQSKILVVVIAGLLVITAVVSAIAVTMTHDIMHQDADRILNNVTQKEAAYINDVLGDIKKSAAIMAHYATQEVEDVAQLADMDFRAKYVAKTRQMFMEIALNTSEVDGFFFRLNPEHTDSTTGFYNLVVAEDEDIIEMTVTDLSQYSSDDDKNVGWYYTAVEAGEGVWLEPYYFPGHDQQMISYTIPVYVKGELLGVVGFDMDFSYLVERIDNLSVYEHGYAVLLATDGETPYNNVEREESTAPHTKATVALQNGMYLELRAEYQDIQSDLHPMLARIVVAFVVVLFFSILYTVVVTHRIVRPLKQLTAAAEGLSSGLDTADIGNIPVNSKDEIGTLATVLRDTYGQIREYTSYINALAYRDSLTGIKNSTAYTEAIAELNGEINRGNPRFGVLVADINNLKQANDRYGHDIGNELIIHTAKILTEIFKTSAVFRIGGDEFAVVLKDADYADYRRCLAELSKACEADYITVCESRIPVSIAVGVASFDPTVDRVYEDVFAKADHAMYLNKEESKAQTVRLS